jgi:hypothetical protein
MNNTLENRAKETAEETEPYTPPELTVVGELRAVTKGSYRWWLLGAVSHGSYDRRW